MSETKRPSFEEIYLTLARHFALRSTCKRLQVGTVITSVDYRKVLAVGYNGNAAGLPNRCDSDEIGNCGCLHSEMNAMINCDCPRDTKKIVFVSHSPCVMCAKGLINLGNVVKVYFYHNYRSTEGLKLLQSQKIATEQLTPTFGATE